jgi:hypothetical protein
MRLLTEQERVSAEYARGVSKLYLELLPYRGKFRWYVTWKGALFSWTGENQRRAVFWDPAFESIEEAMAWVLSEPTEVLVRLIVRRGEGTHVSDNPRLITRKPVLEAVFDKEFHIRFLRTADTPPTISVEVVTALGQPLPRAAGS